ncbi:MAG: glycosyltransferase family 4 protein [Prevotella sp.]
MKILINAYACSPGMGSEPGMAWNWCLHLAKHCELHIITEGEFRDKIEAVVPTLPQGKNMHFYYNPVGGDNIERCEKIRRMCWNQGDWRFYKYYREWQWKTYLMAKEICSKEKIDILHQLNMIGFREPGYLWKLSEETGIRFVWGPVGGLKQFPMAYTDDGGLKMKLFMKLKNFINIMQLKYDSRVDKALNQASLLISSIPDSYNAIKRFKGLESVIVPETGCFDVSDDADVPDRFLKTRMQIIWVGKFDFRKRLDIALKAVAQCHNRNVQLSVYGTGTGSQISYYKRLSAELGIERQVVWKGNQSNELVKKAMSESDVFLFTSVSEDTSTVVLEAVSCGLPVVCFDAYGMANVINDRVGRKVPLSNPNQSVKDFAKEIDYLYLHRDVLKEMSDNCRNRQLELSWDRKAEEMVKLCGDLLH